MKIYLLILAAAGFTVAIHTEFKCVNRCDTPAHCLDDPCQNASCSADTKCYVNPCDCTHRCLRCHSGDYVFCDNPCADFNASVISTGYSCHQNPCDCTVFFAADCPNICSNIEGSCAAANCQSNEKCVINPCDSCTASCIPNSRVCDGRECSPHICTQANCDPVNELCVVDNCTCNAKCMKNETCDVNECMVDNCVGFNCTLNFECRLDPCSCNATCQECQTDCSGLESRCTSFQATNCTDSEMCELEKCGCQPYCKNCTATCTGNECANAGLNCPNGEKCVTDPCCRTKCEACSRSNCLTFNETCMTDADCGSGEKCYEELCDCKKTCKSCQEIGCNTIYNENCTSGCPDGYSCKRDFCNCSDSCQPCTLADCTSPTLPNACGGTCPQNQECVNNLCTCQRECKACNSSNCGACATVCPAGQQCTQDDCCIQSCQPCQPCANYTDNCQGTCPSAQVCSNDDCSCTQICTDLAPCETGGRLSFCKVNENTAFFTDTNCQFGACKNLNACNPKEDTYQSFIDPITSTCTPADGRNFA